MPCNMLNGANSLRHAQRIACVYFIMNIVGNEQVLGIAAGVPSELSELLARAGDGIGAGRVGQVTDDRCFKVDGVHDALAG